MASIAELLEAQAAILRVQLNAEAAAVSAAATPLDTYVEQLIERAELNSQPALLVFEFITGATPTSAQLDSLTAFAELQFNFYNDVLGVANPGLGPYEALGRSLTGETGFVALSTGKTDAEFIQAVYVQASDPGGAAPSPAQIQHFQDQIDFFEALYIGSGIPAATALQQARGAVLGQIVGLFAMQEGSALDNLAENFFRQAHAGFAVYDVPLESIPDINAPPPPTGILAVLTDTGGEVLTGTPQDDLFRGGGNDIDSSDTLLGLGGQDAAQLFLYDGFQYSLNSVGVEDFFLSPDGNGGGNDYYFSFENVEGLETVHVEDLNNAQDMYLFDLQNNVDFFFEDAGTNAPGDVNIHVYFENGAVGEEATLSLDLVDSYIDHLHVYTYDDDFFSELEIEANGQDAYLEIDLTNDLASDETLTRLTVSGDAYIALFDDGDEFNSLEEIDFSGNTGGTYLDLDESNADFTFTGGDGDDYLDIDGEGFDGDDSVDGGDGEDTLEVIANEGVNATGANVENVEHLRLSDELSGGGDVLLINTAGFDDLTLEDETTNDNDPGGNNMVIAGFDEIFIEGDQSGSIEILNPAVTITFQSLDEPGDDIYVDLLDVHSVSDVTINIIDETDGNYDLVIDTLDLEGPALDTDTLTFTGDGDIDINNIVFDPTDVLDLVDLSDFEGTFGVDDNFGPGVDFLIGNLGDYNDNRIFLEGDDNDENELVFTGPDFDNYLYITDFDITGAGADTLDLGGIATSLADLTFTDLGNDWLIEANAGQFDGAIRVDGVGDITGSLLAFQARIEFDGALG